MVAHKMPAASLKIQEIMTKEVISIEVGRSVAEAVKMLIENDIECLPITRSQILQGVITFRDIVTKVVYRTKNPERVAVEEIMVADPITCCPDSTVLEVVKLMKNKKLRRFPVVDENKRLVGIVTNFDLAIFGWSLE